MTKRRHRTPRPGPDDVVAFLDATYREALTHRPPVRWCTYRAGSEVTLGAMRGPNTLGEYMVVVTVETLEDGSVRVGWAFAIVDDFERLGITPPRGRQSPTPRSTLPKLVFVPRRAA